ncbi:MAG: YraN family protein [Lachnospiraceae bacterium]|nr:YraN family protein [Lachnospiraceae bacterium]
MAERHKVSENKRQTGSRYEELAARGLKENGWTVLETGYRTRSGEIDLIALDPENTLVFCEVKYRSAGDVPAALEAVDYRKQRQIIRMARLYLMKHPESMDYPMRFDVIGIGASGETAHIENAFDAGM